MNDIQKLLKLKGVSIRDLAALKKVGYHSLQKYIKGHRKTPSIRKVLASYLNIQPDALVGTKSRFIIRFLIEKEIEIRTQTINEELKKKYLGKAA